MTDQPQAARPDGDGLSREQITEYVRELNTIAAECEIAGTAELSRAAHNLYRIAKQWFKSLPARDAAEGRGPLSLALNWVDCPICGESDMRCETFDEGMTLIRCTNHGCPSNKLGAAPPKSALDAVRLTDRELYDNSCITRHQLANWVDSDYASHIGGLKHTIEFLLARLDAFSAPVPPADGAIAAMTEALASQYGIPDELWKGASKDNPMVPSGTGAPDPGLDKFKREVAAHYGAVEPVACWVIPGNDTADANGFISAMAFKDGEFTKPLYAAPPVRGDRESLAETIHKARFSPDRSPTPFAKEDSNARAYCFRIADAVLLSLPVQPGAGEREATIEECRSIFEGVKNVLEFAIGLAWDAERLIPDSEPKRLRNTLNNLRQGYLKPAVERLSRQAPHSSSEVK